MNDSDSSKYVGDPKEWRDACRGQENERPDAEKSRREGHYGLYFRQVVCLNSLGRCAAVSP